MNVNSCCVLLPLERVRPCLFLIRDNVLTLKSHPKAYISNLLAEQDATIYFMLALSLVEYAEEVEAGGT